MATRDVRAVVAAAIEGELRRRGCPNAYVAALAVLAILDGQGIPLVRPAHHHDPDADWRQEPPPQRITPAAAATDYQAAKAALIKQTDPED